MFHYFIQCQSINTKFFENFNHKTNYNNFKLKKYLIYFSNQMQPKSIEIDPEEDRTSFL